MTFKVIDNGDGGYRAVLIADPSIFRDADTFGLAEAYGQELVQDQIIKARNAIYDQIDEDRLLEQANSLMAKRRGRPRKVVIVDETPEVEPAEPRLEGAPVDEDKTS